VKRKKSDLYKDVKSGDISRIKRGNIRKTKLMSLQRIVRISETYNEEYMNLRGATSQKVS
jgi:superfamily I DNA and/or RNA helicase